MKNFLNIAALPVIRRRVLDLPESANKVMSITKNMPLTKVLSRSTIDIFSAPWLYSGNGPIFGYVYVLTPTCRLQRSGLLKFGWICLFSTTRDGTK